MSLRLRLIVILRLTFVICWEMLAPLAWMLHDLRLNERSLDQRLAASCANDSGVAGADAAGVHKRARTEPFSASALGMRMSSPARSAHCGERL